MVEKKTAVLFGATGAVGRRLVDALVASHQYSRILLLGRRPVDLSSSSLDYSSVEQQTVNFEKLDESGAAFDGAGVVFCSLGTTRAKSGADGFRKVDYDYVMATAHVAKAHDVPHYLLVSSAGANPNSFFLYPKTKGETERDIAALGFEHFTIARPGFLEGPREDHRAVESVLKVLFAPIKLFCSKTLAISTDAVAKALVVLATSSEAPSGKAIVDNAGLWRLSEEFDKRFTS